MWLLCDVNTNLNDLRNVDLHSYSKGFTMQVLLLCVYILKVLKTRQRYPSFNNNNDIQLIVMALAISEEKKHMKL